MPIEFTLRKVIAPLLFPLSVALELLVVGVVLLWFSRHQKAGRILVTAGTTILLGISLNGPSTWALSQLERSYATPVQQEDAVSSRPPRWVVVLGGGFTPDTSLPVTSQLGPAALARVVEGVRLYKRFPGARLIVSGGAYYDSGPEAAPLAAAAEILGVPPHDIVRENASLDTEDQARKVGEIVGREEFLLVTSASHMPRAMALFQRRGLRPVPVAADYDIKFSPGVSPEQFHPHPENIRRANEAAYEYLGMAWARLRGSI